MALTQIQSERIFPEGDEVTVKLCEKSNDNQNALKKEIKEKTITQSHQANENWCGRGETSKFTTELPSGGKRGGGGPSRGGKASGDFGLGAEA